MAKTTTTTKLTPQQQAKANVAAKAQTGVGVTLHTNGNPIVGLAGGAMPKPTASNQRYISAMGTHPGVGQCYHRWHLYRVGQTLAEIKATAGLTPNDVTFWAKCGYLTLSAPSTAQLNSALQAWQAAVALQQTKQAAVA